MRLWEDVRLLTWLLFFLVHVWLIRIAPDKVAALVAGSVYVPLLIAKSLGIPVFSVAESGGWGNPSSLGWIVASFFWATVWWMIASLMARIIEHFKKQK